VEIARTEGHDAVLVFDAEFAFEDEEEFVLVVVFVPGEVALQLSDLYVLVIDLGGCEGTSGLGVLLLLV